MFHKKNPCYNKTNVTVKGLNSYKILKKERGEQL